METRIYSESDLFKAFRMCERGYSFDDIIRDFNSERRFKDCDRIDLIIQAVISCFKIPLEDFKSSCRVRKLVDARSVYCYVARKHTQKSLTNIGNTLNRHHATVINSLRYIDDMIFCDDQEVIENIKTIEDTYNCLLYTSPSPRDS